MVFSAKPFRSTELNGPKVKYYCKGVAAGLFLDHGVCQSMRLRVPKSPQRCVRLWCRSYSDRTYDAVCGCPARFGVKLFSGGLHRMGKCKAIYIMPRKSRPSAFQNSSTLTMAWHDVTLTDLPATRVHVQNDLMVFLFTR